MSITCALIIELRQNHIFRNNDQIFPKADEKYEFTKSKIFINPKQYNFKGNYTNVYQSQNAENQGQIVNPKAIHKKT